MQSSDGKFYLTDVGDTEQILRLVQSIPSKKEDPKTFNKSKQIAVKGGTVAGNTRRDIEKQLGESIVTPKNAKDNLQDLSAIKHAKLENKISKKKKS